MRLPRLALLALLAAGSASAQPDIRPTVAGPSVSLDALWATPRSSGLATDDQGNVLGEVRAGLLQSVQVISGQAPVGGQITVVGSVPIVITDFEFVGFTTETGERGTEVHVGNPYVGAAGAFREVSAEGGVWIPLATGADVNGSPGAEVVGFGTDYPNAEAYKAETASVRLSLGYARSLGRARLRLAVAPIYSYYIGERVRDPGRSEALAPRGNAAVTGAALVDVRVGPVLATGGFSGRYDPESGRDTFVDGAGRWTYAALAATVDGLPVRPGLSVRVPTSGYRAMDLAVGLSLDVPLR